MARRRRKTSTSEQEDNRPLWRRKQDAIGKLYQRTPGMDPRRMIKPGQYINATPEQLGLAVQQFELIEGDVNVEKFLEKIGPKKAKKEEYTVSHAGNGWYDVLSPDGKVMNEKKLRADEAEALREKLEEEQKEG